jgi:hypothetical protein
MAPDTRGDVVPAEIRRQFGLKAAWHREQAQRPLREKVRILLELQRQELPIIARRRPLRPWERQWPIEP